MNIDQRREVVILPTKEAAIRYAAEDWIRTATDAIYERGRFVVALSGGSTPKSIFELLASDELRGKVDWSKVHLYWSDERCVPPTDPESNYHSAMAAGFSSLPLLPENIHRMKGELEPLEAAAQYDALVQETPFDLIMLGMGADGHTASLFPNTTGPSITDRLVIANFVPQKNTWRLSFTFPLINSAGHIAVYALGEEKAPILKQVLSTDPNLHLPAMRVGTDRVKALWILDQAAAEQLKFCEEDH